MAENDKRVLTTKDMDFLDSFLLKGKPIKFDIIRTGNIGNKELISLTGTFADQKEILLNENSLIEITRTEVIVHAQIVRLPLVIMKRVNGIHDQLFIDEIRRHRKMEPLFFLLPSCVMFFFR